MQLTATDLDEAAGVGIGIGGTIWPATQLPSCPDAQMPSQGCLARLAADVARLTLILIPATDLPAASRMCAKSDRATCVQRSWQFCFALGHAAAIPNH